MPDGDIEDVYDGVVLFLHRPFDSGMNGVEMLVESVNLIRGDSSDSVVCDAEPEEN